MVSEMTVDRTNAIQKIVDGIYMNNRENTDVISSICTLFIELSHYGQILLAFVDLLSLALIYCGNDCLLTLKHIGHNKMFCIHGLK